VTTTNLTLVVAVVSFGLSGLVLWWYLETLETTGGFIPYAPYALIVDKRGDRRDDD